jgi:hypothetical protein
MSNTPNIENRVGTFMFYVSSLNKCESISKSMLTIRIDKTPDPPFIFKDSLNNLVSNSKSNIWYKDGIKIGDTTSYVKPLSNGNYSAQTYVNGCLSKMSSPYYYLVSNIRPYPNIKSINIYPNPTSKYLKIDTKLNGDIILNISIIDMTGKQVFSKLIYRTEYIDLSNLNKGNYTLIVKNKSGLFLYSSNIQKF